MDPLQQQHARAEDMSEIEPSLRAWTLEDEVTMAKVDANAVLVASGTSGVCEPCFASSGSQLACAMRWACTFYNAQAQAAYGTVPGIRLRMARASRSDMAILMEMIRGLATFEKEPEAVVTDEDVMLRDGFGPGRQFNVVFAEAPEDMVAALQRLAKSEAGEAEISPSPVVRTAFPVPLIDRSPAPLSAGVRAAEYTPIAFAFTHGAYSTWEGRVLYLEDLYVQPWARRMGLSGIMLTTVARAAHVAKCARVQWAALDWNTPAIGAYVHPRVGATPLNEWTAFRLYRADIERVSGLPVDIFSTKSSQNSNPSTVHDAE